MGEGGMGPPEAAARRRWEGAITARKQVWRNHNPCGPTLEHLTIRRISQRLPKGAQIRLYIHPSTTKIKQIRRVIDDQPNIIKIQRAPRARP